MKSVIPSGAAGPRAVPSLLRREQDPAGTFHKSWFKNQRKNCATTSVCPTTPTGTIACNTKAAVIKLARKRTDEENGKKIHSMNRNLQKLRLKLSDQPRV